jgi:hypothetical protein
MGCSWRPRLKIHHTMNAVSTRKTASPTQTLMNEPATISAE